MKICILTPRFPFPENGGDVLRINNIARYLKGQGHKLLLVSFCDNSNVDMEEANDLYGKVFLVKRKKVMSFAYSLLFMLRGLPIQCGYYHSPIFRKLFHEVVVNECPDRYISHLLRMAPYLEKEHLCALSTVEMTDALSKTYSLSSRAKGLSFKKIIYKIELKLIKKYEEKVIKIFPKVVVVSHSDLDFLKQSIEHTKSLVLHTNGVDCLSDYTGTYKSNKISFIGNMRTLQNQDAVLHFVKKIFPVILKHNPKAVFYIVGAQPSHEIMSLDNKKNIIVTGFVEDLVGMISDSCLAVAPVNIAAGIQNKVLMAMGCGIPVVMTSLISKAIPELKNGENCFICDDDNDFANICIQIMENSVMRDKIGRNGFDMVKSNYSWKDKLNGY